MSPAFTSGKMKAMFHLMEEPCKLLDREFDKLATLGQDIHTKETFSKLTIMVIARCAFATNVDAFNDKDSELLKQLNTLFDINNFTIIRFLILTLFPTWLSRCLKMGYLEPSNMKYLSKVCAEILKQRRANAASSNEYPDLLQLITDAKTIKEGTNEEQGFSDIKIIANSLLFFIAGFETTSTLLFWSSYALAMNPDVQDKLHAVVKEAKEKSGELDYDTLQSIKYLDAFIHETLRVYPPVNEVLRQCTEDHVLPNGLHVEKGTTIVVPIYYIHHDETNYPEPEMFDPERFMPENKNQIEPCTFLSFVDGPRNCVGKRFALLEAKLTLANLLLKYEFKKSPKTPEKPVFDENSFVLHAVELPIQIVKRK